MIISGTKGYIYVPSPWWLTNYFEVRFENQSLNEKHYYKFDGDGLRYELVEFYLSIASKSENLTVRDEESIAISKVIEEYHKRNTIKK